MLVCVTEMNSRDEIDDLVDALNDVAGAVIPLEVAF